MRRFLLQAVFVLLLCGAVVSCRNESFTAQLLESDQHNWVAEGDFEDGGFPSGFPDETYWSLSGFGQATVDAVSTPNGTYVLNPQTRTVEQQIFGYGSDAEDFGLADDFDAGNYILRAYALGYGSPTVTVGLQSDTFADYVPITDDAYLLGSVDGWNVYSMFRLIRPTIRSILIRASGNGSYVDDMRIYLQELGTNLLANGSFETGTPGEHPIDGWESETDTVSNYSTVGTTRPYTGTQVGLVGSGGNANSLTQHIDISAFASAIDAGNLRLRAIGYLKANGDSTAQISFTNVQADTTTSIYATDDTTEAADFDIMTFTVYPIFNRTFDLPSGTRQLVYTVECAVGPCVVDGLRLSLEGIDGLEYDYDFDASQNGADGGDSGGSTGGDSGGDTGGSGGTSGGTGGGTSGGSSGGGGGGSGVHERTCYRCSNNACVSLTYVGESCTGAGYLDSMVGSQTCAQYCAGGTTGGASGGGGNASGGGGGGPGGGSGGAGNTGGGGNNGNPFSPELSQQWVTPADPSIAPGTCIDEAAYDKYVPDANARTTCSECVSPKSPTGIIHNIWELHVGELTDTDGVPNAVPCSTFANTTSYMTKSTSLFNQNFCAFDVSKPDNPRLRFTMNVYDYIATNLVTPFGVYKASPFRCEDINSFSLATDPNKPRLGECAGTITVTPAWQCSIPTAASSASSSSSSSGPPVCPAGSPVKAPLADIPDTLECGPCGTGNNLRGPVNTLWQVSIGDLEDPDGIPNQPVGGESSTCEDYAHTTTLIGADGSQEFRDYCYMATGNVYERSAQGGAYFALAKQSGKWRLGTPFGAFELKTPSFLCAEENTFEQEYYAHIDGAEPGNDSRVSYLQRIDALHPRKDPKLLNTCVGSITLTPVQRCAPPKSASYLVIIGTAERCGDGKVQERGGEQCDDGASNLRSAGDEASPWCSAWCTRPVCSDGRDNDGDGLADAADPGCYNAGDTGGGLWPFLLRVIGRPDGTYLPGKGSERCADGTTQGARACQ